MNLFLTVPTDAEVELGFAVLGVVVIIGAVISLLVYIASSLGYMKMFQKAGIAGWKAFVPFYNDYLQVKIAWAPKMFWFLLITSLVSQILPPSENPALSMIGVICSVSYIVLYFKQNIKMAKAFGKGAGTGVLLSFFPYIVPLVLGFGKAEYVGPLK